MKEKIIRTPVKKHDAFDTSSAAEAPEIDAYYLMGVK